jgi:hypothetical protein
MDYIRRMPRAGLLLVVFACAPPAVARMPFTVSDSEALVAEVAADLRASYPALAQGVFVLDSSRSSRDTLTARVVATLQATDATEVIKPQRTTPRAVLGQLVIVEDTATISVAVNTCRANGGYGGTGSVHRYVRSFGRWTRDPRRLVETGHGINCPW